MTMKCQYLHSICSLKNNNKKQKNLEAKLREFRLRYHSLSDPFNEKGGAHHASRVGNTRRIPRSFPCLSKLDTPWCGFGCHVRKRLWKVSYGSHPLKRNKYSVESANCNISAEKQRPVACWKDWQNVRVQTLTIDPPVAKTTAVLVHKLPPLSGCIWLCGREAEE